MVSTNRDALEARTMAAHLEHEAARERAAAAAAAVPARVRARALRRHERIVARDRGQVAPGVILAAVGCGMSLLLVVFVARVLGSLAAVAGGLS